MANQGVVRGAGARATVGVALAAVLLFPAGCKKQTVDDASVTAAVQSKIQGDGAISTEPIQVSTQSGTVTLTGQVSNAAARSLAANDASTVTGVQKVVNDIVVAQSTATVSTMSTTPQTTAPAPTVERSRTRTELRSTIAHTRSGYQPAPPPPVPIERAQTPSAPAYVPPATPPPPAFKNVTVPAGTVLPVRITQTLDSETTRAGDSFSGALATDLVQDGVVVLPRGAAVSGTVADAKDAGHFKGSSLLSIQLTSVSRRGMQIPVSTEPFSKEGAGRGKNTAVKTGVGAAAGAVLGGIFGGGKGAAIGAAAGGGTGAGINAVTRGQQVQIPSETVVRFTTTNSFSVRTSSNDVDASNFHHTNSN